MATTAIALTRADTTSGIVRTATITVVSTASTGAQGIQGPQGIQGIQGIQGPIGSTGAVGPTGPTGPTGTAATIAVGTVTTGAAGSSATVTNAGTSSAAVFNFSIPKGDPGNVTSSVTNTFTTNQIIEGSSASAMLRITQTGAGNALVVEDSANPDSSPFVIDASGNVLIGATSGTGSSAFEIFSDGSLGQTIRGAGAAGGRILLQRLNGTNAAPTTVAANNVLGQILVSGYSGSAYTSAAAINFSAEGTISAGVVPGNIAFTIANSAGTLTERMKIDSGGRFGIGASPTAGRGINFGVALTGGIQPLGIFNAGAIQSDATSGAIYYGTWSNTAASAGAIPIVVHYQSTQGTIGASSSIGTQVGFLAASTLTGATNNWGFQGDIASGTGRYNLYMSGTADNYLAGSLGIGTTPVAGRSLIVGKAITGATTSFGIAVNGGIQSDVTGAVQVVRSAVSTAAASFTLSGLYNFYIAGIATPGAGSTITNQYGFYVDNALTGATNNYAFYGDIPSASNRWNLFMNGTAANYMAGRLGVGATLTSGAMAQITNTTAGDIGFVIKGAASQTGNLQQWQNSASTVLAYVAADGSSSFYEGDQNILATSIFS